MTPETRRATWLLAGGCLPFAAGAILSPQDGPGVCLFRATTGLPCPLCGGTRAFAYAARGDVRFLDYNAVWVLAAAAAILLGVAGLIAAAAGRAPLARAALALRGPRRASVALVLAAAIPWAYAFAQRATIVS
jgi:hypothetical protein